MFICCLRAKFYIPGVKSLKAKRSLVKSLTQRIKNNFNVSIAQKPDNRRRVCEFFIVGTGYQKDDLYRQIQLLSDYLNSSGDIYLASLEQEMI